MSALKTPPRWGRNPRKAGFQGVCPPTLYLVFRVLCSVSILTSGDFLEFCSLHFRIRAEIAGADCPRGAVARDSCDGKTVHDDRAGAVITARYTLENRPRPI